LSFDLWFASIASFELLPSIEGVMALARKRRRLPTVVEHGLGLLEVILPRGAPSEAITALPAGQRDSGGFWFPAGYSQPGDIFTPAQRRLQAKQRQVQRVRHGKGARPAAIPESRRAAAAPTSPRPDSGPASETPDVKPAAMMSRSATIGLADRAVPLPPPAFEAPGVDDSREPGRMRIRTSPAPLSAAPQYADRREQRVAPPPVIVDSHKGSD
jgi:hypothetical protein